MALKYLLLGFFVKIVTGFDDTITHIPILASVTKTRFGKFMFAIGAVFAIIAAIIISMFFATLLQSWPYARFVSAGLIFLLAIAIYGDFFCARAA